MLLEKNMKSGVYENMPVFDLERISKRLRNVTSNFANDWRCILPPHGCNFKYLMKEIGPAQTIWARYTVQAVIVTVLICKKCLWENKLSKTSVLRSVALMMAITLFFFAFSSLDSEASAIFNISPVLITLGAFYSCGNRLV